MTPTDPRRIEWRAWLAAGMPKHPLFAPELGHRAGLAATTVSRPRTPIVPSEAVDRRDTHS